MKINEQTRILSSPADTMTEDEKQQKKQKIVRNEFKLVGKYGMPLIRKQDIDLSKIEPWCYTKTKSDDIENAHKTIHFFTYDWNFEAIYSKPEVTFEKLAQYYALLTPEFSTYTNTCASSIQHIQKPLVRSVLAKARHERHPYYHLGIARKL